MRSTSKKFLRNMSSVLSVSLLVNLVSVTMVDAQTGQAGGATQKKALQAAIGELPNKLPKTKLELTSKRTKYSTRFLNPDGSFTEEIFATPQYYQDPTDKKWKKIDNTLKSSSTKAGKFENTANDVKTLLSQEAGTGDLASVEKDGKSVALVPVNANQVKATTKGNEITYPGIFSDTDAQYLVQGDTLKENLVLTKYHQNTFSYELKLNGVKPVVNKAGTIQFFDNKGNVVWAFKDLFMTDAKGKYSNKVSLKLRQEKGKTYVDVVADDAFLKDPNTAYPVTIDPSIDTWDVQRDNFVASSFPTSIYKSGSSLETGSDSYFGTTRSLVQFFLPSLPSDSKISGATFKAYQTSTDATNVSVDLDRITSAWTDSVTWNTQPTIQSTPESTTTSNAANSYWQWSVTNLVKDWYNGNTPNYGFMLKQQNETTSPDRTFNSVNSTSNTPELSINYTIDPIGFENFWAYTPDGVNPANGNLVLQSNDLQIPGRGIPVQVQRVYNSRKSGFAGLFGYGWTSNLEAQVVDAGSGPITLIDGDGTRHIFGQSLGSTYVAAGGVYLTLVKNADGTYTVTDTDGSKQNYNTSGKLSSLVDSNNNKTSFTYDSNGKLTTITDATNRTTTLTYGTNGYVASIIDPAKHTIQYGYDASGNLTTLTDAAGKVTTVTYDASHNLTSSTNPRNIKTTFTYDTSDRLTTISSPLTVNGTVQTNTTTYTYDTTNLVTSVTDGEGRRMDYTYNANGNVVQTTQDPLDAANKAITYYAYDNNNNLTQVKDANANRLNKTGTYTYTYDDNGNITGKQLPEGQTSTSTYDSQNNLVDQKDFNTNESKATYDANNNQTDATDPSDQTAASRYYPTGALEYSTPQMSAADNKVPNSSMELDTNADNWPDNWVKTTETGKTATYAWSSTSKFGGKSISISNPTGYALAQSDMIPYASGDQYIVSGYVKTAATTGTSVVKVEYYDANENYLGQKAAYELAGTHDWTRIQAVVQDLPAGTSFIRVSVGLNAGSGTAYFDGVQLEKGTTLSNYNLLDNSSFERNAGLNKVPNNWTASSNWSATADGIDQKVNTDDDNAYVGNYAVKLTGQAATNKYLKQHVTVSGDATTPFTLSGWSKQVGADPNGGVYTMQVGVNYTDGTVGWFSNDFSKTTANWQHVAAEIKPTKAFTSVDVYDEYYNQTGTAWFDAMRLETGAPFTNYTYESTGNYVSHLDKPLGQTESYLYDPIGNMTSLTDGKGQKTSYTYDARNMLTQATDAKAGITSYAYDANGNLSAVTDAKNNKTSYAYNEADQVSSVTNALNKTIQFGYDRTGNMTKVTTPNGDTVSYGFDALNHNTSISQNGVTKWTLGYDANGNLTSATDATGKAMTYSYDSNNRLTTEKDGTSDQLDYVYDNNGNPTSLTATAGATSVASGYTYNPMNQVTAISRNGANQAKFIYDERGNVISITRANGTYSAFEYDDANHVKSMKNYNNAGALMDSYTYTYDANGNRTSIATSSGTISYQYDALNEVTQETLADGTVNTYTYDAVGNRTKKTVTKGTTTTTTTYTYDAANELTAVNGQAYTYDANGNLLSNGAKTFVYDAENHLTQVKDATGKSLATYTYDRDGTRLSATTASGTTYYHYNNNQVIYETDANNNITADYTYDPQGNPATMTKNGYTYYYHLNGHGDVMSLTDANGATVAQYQYDAYGNILSATGAMATANPYRYAGYRYDDTTGLYYLMSRYYNPEVGRFLNADDPLVIKQMLDQSSTTPSESRDMPMISNTYVYGANNPVMNIDPSGYYWGNHWWNGRTFLVYIFNLVISFIIEKPVEMLGSYLKKLALKYKVARAAVIFSQSLKRKLLAKGISARIASFASNTVLQIFMFLEYVYDPGTKIFNALEMSKWDHHHHNNFLNF